MNTALINFEPFLSSPFKVVLSDKSDVQYPDAGLGAVKADDGCLYLGTTTGTYAGNAFMPTACYAAGAWQSIHTIK
jgi:hypothetical protein